MTAEMFETIVYGLAILTTVVGLIAVVGFIAVCALSGLSAEWSRDDLAHLQAEIDLFQARQDDAAPAAAVSGHPTLREMGYYTSAAHAARQARVDRAHGGSDVA